MGRASPPAYLLWSSLLLLCNLTLSHASDDGLIIKVTKFVSCTRPTLSGDVISVHYRGTLLSDGTEFDNSNTRGDPIKFPLGEHHVIQGWDDGLLDMCIGEERTLTIPPGLAYGDHDVGSIPAGSTLVFTTKLVAIEGVVEEKEPTPTTSNVDRPSSTNASSSKPHKVAQLESESGPHHANQAASGECRLLGPFALVVQSALGLLAMLSLVYKRWREHPRRPLLVWFFDVSKQVVGTAMLHVFNIAMSMFSGQPNRIDAVSAASLVAEMTKDRPGPAPNPCSFYLLNLAIDTTIGIPVLVVFLRVLHALFLRTPLANPPESIKSGHYGSPARVSWWSKQCLIYFIGLFGMKLFVFFLFAALPWLAYVGDWALRWTEGNESLQIAFVMFLFPLAMNAMQYYIIDSVIKDKDQQDDHGRYQGVAQSDESSAGSLGSDEQGSTDELGRPRDREEHESRLLSETEAELIKGNTATK